MFFSTLSNVRVPFYRLKCAKSIDAIVTEISSPSLIWCQIKRDVVEFEPMMTKLKQTYHLNHNDHDVRNINVGDFCVARCSADSCFYRARILDIDGEIVKVLFIDYGNQEAVHIRDIDLLLPEFADLPAQAFPCTLYNVIPEGCSSWPYEATKLLSKFIGSDAVVKLQSPQPPCWRTYFVDIACCKVNLADELLETFARTAAMNEVLAFCAYMSTEDIKAYNFGGCHTIKEYSLLALNSISNPLRKFSEVADTKYLNKPSIDETGNDFFMCDDFNSLIDKESLSERNTATPSYDDNVLPLCDNDDSFETDRYYFSIYSKLDHSFAYSRHVNSDDGKIKVIVTHCASPSSFYAHIFNDLDSYIEELNFLNEIILFNKRNLQLFRTDADILSALCLSYDNKGDLLRAAVLTVEDYDTYYLKSLDFGHCWQTSRDNIFYLPDTLLIPPFAFHCKLLHFDEVLNVTPDLIRRFQNFISSTYCQMFTGILCDERSVKWKYNQTLSIILMDESQQPAVTHYNALFGNSQRVHKVTRSVTNDHPRRKALPWIPSDNSDFNIKLGIWYYVKITCIVDFDEYYVVFPFREASRECYRTNPKFLQPYMEKDPTLQMLTVDMKHNIDPAVLTPISKVNFFGELVIVRYKQNWYRGLVTGTQSDPNTLIVFLIDYGWTVHLDINNVYYIPRIYKNFPPQAMLVRLNARSKHFCGDSDPKNLVQAFKNRVMMMKVINYPNTVEICDISTGSEIIFLSDFFNFSCEHFL